MASYNTIKVVARFRPQNKLELASGGQPVVEFETEDTCSVQSREAQGAFTFDRVFDMNSRQTDVFDFSIRSTVDDILNGYNGTVFAYGQTGAGKSYTMMGSDIDDHEMKGIIPRIVEQIFASIMASSGNIEYTVRVSYMEIYMERIRDLLAPQNDNLPIHEEKNRGVYVKGLLELYVSSVLEVYEIMRRGGLARAVAATNMNQESSRSHSIFVVTVSQKNVETGSAKIGQLFLVDLAGSEKVGKTGASGQTLEEAKKINKSLSALGMVINSLTDGKSKHIPYRDSKLTRILQESLGGNSRTTLIINCSPSSYNAEETVSTLRFGVRAKAIKNKAKINAELSPAELKSLLRKAQTQVTTFENYILSLESEVSTWRRGETIPKEQWTPYIAHDKAGSMRKPEMRPRPETPSRAQSSETRHTHTSSQSESRRMDTPSRSESRMEIDRASTPSVILEKDEREEFLRRENELQDQLAEKETQIANAEKRLKEAKEQLAFLKEHDTRTGKENEKLNGEINDLKMQVEKINFETKEAMITMDALKEANSELTSELDEVKQQLLDAKMNAKETGDVQGEKEKKKAERMAQMMAGFDLGSDVFSQKEEVVRTMVDQIERLHDISAAGDVVAPEDLEDLRIKTLDILGVVRQTELSLSEREERDQEFFQREQSLTQQLEELENEFEELVERKLTPADVEDVKARLGDLYATRQTRQSETVNKLQNDLSRRTEENLKMKSEIQDLLQRVKSAANGVNGAVGGKTVQQQIAEFDHMKKSLMRDLQNRCERVVELEISLDATREQYAAVLRASNSKAQQKKMAFLERNLEQLTHVQRQLVEQNSTLKKEVAIAERKLVARNERIGSLEALLGDSQEKLVAANHRFEAQLTAVKERLEAAKVGSTRGLASFGSPNGNASAAFGFGNRIAKPLRGGGGGGGVGDQMNGWVGAAIPVMPSMGNLHAQEVGGGGGGVGGGGGTGKRSSWFFNQRT